MIYIYNEIDEPQWKLVTKNNKIFSRIINIHNDLFGIDLVKPVEATEEDDGLGFDNSCLQVFETNKLIKVSTLNNNVSFDNKRMSPFIRVADDNSRRIAIILLTINLKDRHIGNIYSSYPRVLAHSYTGDLCHLIISMEETPYAGKTKKRNNMFINVIGNDGKSYHALKLIYDNKNGVQLQVRDLVPPVSNKDGALTIDKSVDNKFRIRNYHPTKPLKVVIYDGKVCSDIKGLVTKNFVVDVDSMNFLDTSAADFNKALETIRENKYKVATVLVNKSRHDILDKDFDKKTVNNYGFKYINILSNDGKIIDL